MKQVLINNSIFFSQVAILEGGMLQDFMYNEKSNENLLGNIYKGRVVNILPGMEAAFIDIGLNKNAYIFKDDLLSDKFLKEKNVKKKDVTSLSRILKSGEEILVQINREPIGEKNISVTTDISIPGKFIALIPNSIEVNISSKIKDEEERKRLLNIGKKIMSNGNGMIIRTFAANCTEKDLLNEYNLLSSIYSRIVKEYGYSYAPKLLYKSNSLIEKVFLDHIDGSVDEIYVEDSATRTELEELIKSLGTGKLESIKVVQSRNVFEFFNIEKQIDMLFERKIELDSGGSIFIDVTEAMTVIDVNSGKFVGKDNMEDTALSLNISALNEIARQIKLRNLSGIIIIDFIDMKSQENIDYLVNSAIKEFRKDKAKINVLGMTKLNLMELTRKKDKENFFNLMTVHCEHCSGSGRVPSIIQIKMKIENIVNKVKKNTSSEAVVLRTGSMLYEKISKCGSQFLDMIQEKYGIKIYIKEDRSIVTKEIMVEKMGKIEYINSEK